jgi:hypothetical protein
MASVFDIMRQELLEAFDDPKWREDIMSLRKMDIVGFHKYYTLGIFGPNRKALE